MNPHPWMRHAGTGHYAQLPADPYWLAQGWEPADGPPPEPDRLHDPVLQDPETPPEPVGSSAPKAKKSAAAEKESTRG
jgi:hypothetical protein